MPRLAYDELIKYYTPLILSCGYSFSIKHNLILAFAFLLVAIAFLILGYLLDLLASICKKCCKKCGRNYC